MNLMANYRIDRGVSIPKSKLHPNPWNPNQMKPRQREAAKESVDTYGQVIELLVRPHPDREGEYQIIDGEHRYHIVSEEEVYCNVIHDLPDADAKKLTIVMNETKGSANKNDLAALLSELSSEFGDDLLTALPYEMEEVDALLVEFDDPFRNPPKNETGEKEPEPTYKPPFERPPAQTYKRFDGDGDGDEDYGEDDEDVIEFSGSYAADDGSTSTLSYMLKFGRHRVVLDEDEYNQLEHRIAEYQRANGSNFGFVRWLLKCQSST